MAAPTSRRSDLRARRAIVFALLASLALGAACSSAPRRTNAAPASATASAPTGSTSAAPSTAAPGEDVIAEAHALWTRLRVTAEKACVVEANDPSRGWIDRTLDTDGRALFNLLSRAEFEPYAAMRGEIRARLLFVIKPPTVEDRREAILAVDRGFAEILKRRGRPASS